MVVISMSPSPVKEKNFTSLNGRGALILDFSNGVIIQQTPQRLHLEVSQGTVVFSSKAF